MNYFEDAVELLKELISIQSFSREEDQAATAVRSFLTKKGVDHHTKGHNTWAWAWPYKQNQPVILLNSHIDTVRPSSKWTKNPFTPTLEGDKLYGLGSNDAGASLVSLLAAFLQLRETEQSYNLLYAATSEEEISGVNGISSIFEELGEIDLGIVGEPTQMHMAVAEKGLLVLDCIAKGKAGHAARDEGDNAIYKAMKNIEWFKNFQFPIESPHLGKVKMTVTQIEAGSQHNVVPDTCKFVVDVRLTDSYSNKETYNIIKDLVDCEVTPRSFRLNSSCINMNHPIVLKGKHLGRTHYGSPTSSDQALMNFTTIKIGPGDSARSHTADEYICLNEIKDGISIYYDLLNKLNIEK